MPKLDVPKSRHRGSSGTHQPTVPKKCEHKKNSPLSVDSFSRCIILDIRTELLPCFQSRDCPGLAAIRADRYRLLARHRLELALSPSTPNLGPSRHRRDNWLWWPAASMVGACFLFAFLDGVPGLLSFILIPVSLISLEAIPESMRNGRVWGWMAKGDVIPSRCSKPCWKPTPHVDPDHPHAA
jgi:hypothetical protein